MTDRQSLTRYAWLSVLAAVITISLKAGAYWLTGSVGLLSDALESVVNLVAAVIALGALTIAARPPDEDHEYGHDKIEYFSGGVEGTLILLAAASIAFTSVERLLHPQPLEAVGIGLAISVLASGINLWTARVLLIAARKYHSVTLEADAHHLLTDVWTSAGVILGVLLVAVTGLYWLDPVIALLVAAQILRAGIKLVTQAARGLMDMAIAAPDRDTLEQALTPYRKEGIDFHALRTRQSGARQFISMHVLVPGDWSVQRGHNLLERLENDIRRLLPRAHVTTHLEPLGDSAAMKDIELDRPAT